MSEDATTTQLVELTRDDCLRLLAGANFGRVAVNAAGWAPLIRPVFYVFDERSQSVVFRSTRGSKLSSLLRSERAAFEIDGIDAADQIGWSVIVLGRVEEITAVRELNQLASLGLPPSAALALDHCMRIRTTVVTGRRLPVTPTEPRACAVPVAPPAPR